MVVLLLKIELLSNTEALDTAEFYNGMHFNSGLSLHAQRK